MLELYIHAYAYNVAILTSYLYVYMNDILVCLGGIARG